MGVLKNAVKFAAGSVAGAAAGAAAAILLAPESGNALQASIRKRIRDAKLAGAEAKVAKVNELIRKFRAEVSDSTALSDAERHAREERDQTVTALGLGFNAPGAIAAQEVPSRMGDS